MTPESLPIEYSITGFVNSATTSRMMAIDSASSRCSCKDRVGATVVVIVGSRGERQRVERAARNEE